jgi:hypothetical protein
MRPSAAEPRIILLRDGDRAHFGFVSPVNLPVAGLAAVGVATRVHLPSKRESHQRVEGLAAATGCRDSLSLSEPRARAWRMENGGHVRAYDLSLCDSFDLDVCHAASPDDFRSEGVPQQGIP